VKITKIVNDTKGESHFRDCMIDLKDNGSIGRLSKAFSAKSIIFRENDAHYNYSWHTAPRRQYIVMLDGKISIQVSDGEIRNFCGGDVFIVEDTKGKGHKSKSIDGKPRRSLFIPF